MRCLALGAMALVILGCRTHTVDDCRPACNAEDQTFFAHCVANGLADPMTPCAAGNRRCCALAADCIGELDDQTVVTTQTDCALSDVCERPCDTEMDPLIFHACVSGGTANCAAGDEHCCALGAHCLGDLGEWTVSAEGCCQTTADCGANMECSTDTWECTTMTTGPVCGNGHVETGEACDPGPTVDQDCTYGPMTCQVCNDNCMLVGGTPHFCGDGTIDSGHETCEPPSQPLICSVMCQSLQAATCDNSILDGTESDIDCGGGACAACTPGRICAAPGDCRSEHLGCGGTADCSSDNFCTEMTRCGPVTGRDHCLDYGCPDVSGACADESTLPGYDHDHDGHGPSGAGCANGDDCDDLNPTVFAGAPELCDHIDNDCDEMIDEDCTP